MKLIKINDSYINADKIIQIYERPINPTDSDSELVTVIEFEGFGTGNTGPYGEMPYYYQNEVAPHMGAWIEIKGGSPLVFDSTSRTPHGCVD